MPAANYDLFIEQGATFSFTMTYGHKDGTVDANGIPNVVPYDITGCQARMQIRQRPGSKVLISATSRNGGITFDDPTTGKIRVTITDEATDSLNVKRAMYDLELSYPSGQVRRILQGAVRISPQITTDADLDEISTGVDRVYGVDEMDVDMDTEVLDQPSTAF